MAPATTLSTPPGTHGFPRFTAGSLSCRATLTRLASISSTGQVADRPCGPRPQRARPSTRANQRRKASRVLLRSGFSATPGIPGVLVLCRGPSRTDTGAITLALHTPPSLPHQGLRPLFLLLCTDIFPIFCLIMRDVLAYRWGSTLRIAVIYDPR